MTMPVPVPVPMHFPPSLPSSTQALRKVLLTVAAALPMAAAAQAWHLDHEFSFSSGATSAQGAAPVLVGGATVAGGMLQLRGSNAYATFASALIPSAEAGNTVWWSVSLWAREMASPALGSAVLVGQGPATGYLPEFSPALRRESNGLQAAGENQSGWAGAASATVGGVTAGAWHHYATVMRENVVYLYVDGQESGVGYAGHDYSTPYFHGSTRFGQQVAGYGAQFNGDLDDIRIYSGRLDAASIATQFAAGPSAVPELSSVAGLLPGLATLGALRARRT